MLNIYKYHSNPETLNGYSDRVKLIPELAYQYARDHNHRIPELEPTIMKDPFYAEAYAENIIKGRWPEAEPIIITHPQTAYLYASYVIERRWPEAEPIIKQKASAWRSYVHVMKNLNIEVPNA